MPTPNSSYTKWHLDINWLMASIADNRSGPFHSAQSHAVVAWTTTCGHRLANVRYQGPEAYLEKGSNVELFTPDTTVKPGDFHTPTPSFTASSIPMNSASYLRMGAIEGLSEQCLGLTSELLKMQHT